MLRQAQLLLLLFAVLAGAPLFLWKFRRAARAFSRLRSDGDMTAAVLAEKRPTPPTRKDLLGVDTRTPEEKIASRARDLARSVENVLSFGGADVLQTWAEQGVAAALYEGALELATLTPDGFALELEVGPPELAGAAQPPLFAVKVRYLARRGDETSSKIVLRLETWLWSAAEQRCDKCGAPGRSGIPTCEYCGAPRVERARWVLVERRVRSTPAAL